MNILIDKIRIKNFRALKDIEVNLKPITILVGANNSGKTTLLRALNSVLGISRNQINQDDLFIDKDGNQISKEIIIDLRIIPTDINGERIQNFDSKWSSKLGVGIQSETDNEFFAFRTKYNFGIEDNPTTNYFVFTNWENEQMNVDDFKGFNQIRNNIKMFFIDAQRDILEDSKQRTSFFGKLVSQLDYGDSLDELKVQIAKLNEESIEKSIVLKHLKEELKKLNQTTQTRGEGVSLNPFPKKISDLHKGMKVYFQDNQSDAFSMENHGMGTRSWASIITAGAFSSWQVKQIESKIAEGVQTDLLFPIFALEEPEAHLHPNAQRTLYKQLKNFEGQKIISTHSPYIAGQAELEELRHFYKEGDASLVNEILFDKIERGLIKLLTKIIEQEGKTPDAYRANSPKIAELKRTAETKLTESDRKDLVREIFLNKGELLFSKALLLFEGSTEEIALPIFYNKHFGKHPFEDGVTLVGVGGKNNYTPFLKFAKFLKIPVFILSDGDDDSEDKVRSQIQSVYGNHESVFLFVLSNNTDFEQFLYQSGYENEILNAFDKVKSVVNYIEQYINDLDGKEIKKGVIRNYSGQEGKERAIMDCMHGDKTEYPYDTAVNIVESGKALPEIIIQLLDKISEVLNLKIENHE